MENWSVKHHLKWLLQDTYNIIYCIKRYEELWPTLTPALSDSVAELS